jgi:hypothetical protein
MDVGPYVLLVVVFILMILLKNMINIVFERVDELEKDTRILMRERNDQLSDKGGYL